MDKIYFVGDLHLNDVNPRSRIDDYSEAILDKLKDVFYKAEVNGIKEIFFLGDIFHKPSGLSTKYLNKVIETFQMAPCPCYSIIGNHDIPFNRVEDVGNTSLGILFKSGALKHLESGFSHIINNKCCIVGYDYNTDISYEHKNNEELDKTIICISHSYGEDMGFGDTEKPEYFKWSVENENPFDLYILGHDHSYHEDKEIFDGKSKLIRFGALSRVTSGKSDTDRNIAILEVDVDESGQYETRLINIAHKPAIECFSQQALDKDNPTRVNIDLNSSLEDILANLNFSMQSSIFDILDEMNLDQKILDLIEIYLKNNFIVRKD